MLIAQRVVNGGKVVETACYCRLLFGPAQQSSGGNKAAKAENNRVRRGTRGSGFKKTSPTGLSILKATETNETG